MTSGTWIARGAAVTVLGMVLAGCAGTPRQANTSASAGSSPPSAATASAAAPAPNPAAVERASTRTCRDRVSTGRLLPKRVCTTAREDRVEEEASRQQMNNAAYGVPITGGG